MINMHEMSCRVGAAYVGKVCHYLPKTGGSSGLVSSKIQTINHSIVIHFSVLPCIVIQTMNSFWYEQ